MAGHYKLPDGRPEEPHKTVQTVGGALRQWRNRDDDVRTGSIGPGPDQLITKGKCSYVRAVERKLDVLFRGRREYPHGDGSSNSSADCNRRFQ